MEPAEAWTRPCELQLANYWIQEEQPAAGLPLEYASIDIFGDCSHHGCVPESSGGQELPAEYSYYYCSSGAQHNDWSAYEVIHGLNREQVITEEILSNHHQVVDLQNEETKISNDSHASAVFKQVSHDFKAEIDAMKEKMHRYPASLGLHESYTVPRIVAIGPYHHHHPHLKPAEKVKHMATIRCVVESGYPVQEVYDAVASAADDVRRLYDKDVMAGISYDDFRHMMFFDACFLVQFLVMRSGDDIDQSLHSFLSPNRYHIQNDIMLLENQLPWQVVDTVMMFRSVPNLYNFARRFRGIMQDHYHEDDSAPVGKETDAHFEDYKPPHLLGLLRHHIVGTSGDDDETRAANKHSRRKYSSSSASAIELAEIGITLKAKNTSDLIRMGLEEGRLFANLSLAPLTLDRNRASILVNMAALELCVVQNFAAAPVEASAVCAYLLLLAMLVYKEEDVDELRARGILEGGGGLTNQETLHFFTSLQGFRHGTRYFDVMAEIHSYKNKMRCLKNSHACFYRQWNTTWKVIGVAVAIVTIITPVFTFLPHK